VSPTPLIVCSRPDFSGVAYFAGTGNHPDPAFEAGAGFGLSAPFFRRPADHWSIFCSTTGPGLDTPIWARPTGALPNEYEPSGPMGR
jgi:hypothetical protein